LALKLIRHVDISLLYRFLCGGYELSYLLFLASPIREQRNALFHVALLRFKYHPVPHFSVATFDFAAPVYQRTDEPFSAPPFLCINLRDCPVGRAPFLETVRANDLCKHDVASFCDSVLCFSRAHYWGHDFAWAHSNVRFVSWIRRLAAPAASGGEA